MPSAALTPAEALGQLAETAPDLRAAVVLENGSRVASEPSELEVAERLADLAGTVLEEARGAEGERPTEVEVATPGGAVFVLSRGNRSVAAVTGRAALSSLMRYDLRMLLAGLDGAEV